MKTAVYTIAKNEAKHAQRWVDAHRDANHLVICDTGSTDNTVPLALLAGATVIKWQGNPFRFDHARNFCLDHIPADVDWCVSVDMDEMLRPGWREELEQTPVNADSVRHQVVTSFTDTGQPGQTFTINRAHRRTTHRWKYPVHEVLTPLRDNSLMWTNQRIVLEHHPDPTKPRSNYLPMLEQAVADKPNDSRMLWYLGREYMFHGDKEQSRDMLLRYLDVGVWAPEVAGAYRMLAVVDPAEAENYLWHAVGADPNRRENWMKLAEFSYTRKDWLTCRFAAERALRINTRPTDFFCEQWAWGEQAHDYAAIASHWSGDRASAIWHGQQAVAINPLDARLADNMRWYTHGDVAQENPPEAG